MTVNWGDILARSKNVTFPLDITKLRYNQARVTFTRLTTNPWSLRHETMISAMTKTEKVRPFIDFFKATKIGRTPYIVWAG